MIVSAFLKPKTMAVSERLIASFIYDLLKLSKNSTKKIAYINKWLIKNKLAQLENNFTSIYIHTLVEFEYSLQTPEILGIFGNEETIKAFKNSFYQVETFKGELEVILRSQLHTGKSQQIQKLKQAGVQMTQIREELIKFNELFSKFVSLSRTPKETEFFVLQKEQKELLAELKTLLVHRLGSKEYKEELTVLKPALSDINKYISNNAKNPNAFRNFMKLPNDSEFQNEFFDALIETSEKNIKFLTFLSKLHDFLTHSEIKNTNFQINFKGDNVAGKKTEIKRQINLKGGNYIKKQINRLKD